MIFVTVGTTSFPFPRLIRMVNHAVKQLHMRETLVVQTKNKEIPFPTMIRLMKKARIIVCHGGPATIFLALQNSKHKPFVIPRRSKLGEHTDNHQVYFASWLLKENVIAGSLQEDCTQELMRYIKKPTSAVTRSIKSSSHLIRNLHDYVTNNKEHRNNNA